MSDSDSSADDFLEPAFDIPTYSETDEPPSIQDALTTPEGYIRQVRFEANALPTVLHAPLLPKRESRSGYDASSTIVAAPNETDGSGDWLKKQEDLDPHNDKGATSSTSIVEHYDVWVATFEETVQEFRALKPTLLSTESQSSRMETLKNTDLFDKPPSLQWIANRSRMPWIFALMVALEPPFHPDVHHSLRCIARRCRKLSQDPPDESTPTSGPFELFVCLVARSFGQLDILD